MRPFVATTSGLWENAGLKTFVSLSFDNALRRSLPPSVAILRIVNNLPRHRAYTSRALDSHSQTLTSNKLLTRACSAGMGVSRRSYASLAGHDCNRAAEIVTDKLDKPLLDDRTYRVIRLLNQLEVLLIHDGDTDKASAAMDVNVGSFSDADDLPGLAHAVEHLLFMGTKKASSNCQSVLALTNQD